MPLSTLLKPDNGFSGEVYSSDSVASDTGTACLVTKFGTLRSMEISQASGALTGQVTLTELSRVPQLLKDSTPETIQLTASELEELPLSLAPEWTALLSGTQGSHGLTTPFPGWSVSHLNLVGRSSTQSCFKSNAVDPRFSCILYFLFIDSILLRSVNPRLQYIR